MLINLKIYQELKNNKVYVKYQIFLNDNYINKIYNKIVFKINYINQTLEKYINDLVN